MKLKFILHGLHDFYFLDTKRVNPLLFLGKEKSGSMFKNNILIFSESLPGPWNKDWTIYWVKKL